MQNLLCIRRHLFELFIRVFGLGKFDEFDFVELQTSLPASLKRICVLNKADLLNTNVVSDKLLISTRTGSGLGELCNRILATTGSDGANDSATGTFSARLRHVQALEMVQQALANSQNWLAAEHGELAAEELRLAQISLSEITGAFSADDLLGKIFSSFCIGK